MTRTMSQRLIRRIVATTQMTICLGQEIPEDVTPGDLVRSLHRLSNADSN